MKDKKPPKGKKPPEIVADLDYLDGIVAVLPTVKAYKRDRDYLRRNVRRWKRILESARRGARWVLVEAALQIIAEMEKVLEKKPKEMQRVSPV